MEMILNKILSGIDEVKEGQSRLEKELSSVRAELLEELSSVRSELLEEIAILENKVDTNEKLSALRHEEMIREMRLVKIDIGFLTEKTGKHDAAIHQLKTLV